ncbi:MAG: hypothetical protein PVH45_03340, partial [Candidatus Omnitrophota bacterium]
MTTAYGQISDASCDLSAIKYGRIDTPLTAMLDLLDTGGLAVSEFLVDIAEEAEDRISADYTSEKYTYARGLASARGSYVSLQGSAQAAQELALMVMHTPVNADLTDVAAELADVKAKVASEYTQVADIVSSMEGYNVYAASAQALLNSAETEKAKASGASDVLTDIVSAVSGTLAIGEYGALSKTRLYKRGDLIRETIHDDVRGKERELASVTYYTGTDDIRNIMVSEYDDYGVLRKQTSYFRDYFVPESTVKYLDAGGIMQYRGREIPSVTTGFYADGETIESIAVNIYDAITRGTVRVQRADYDLITSGDYTQVAVTFTDTEYTPEEPGRGRVEKTDVYDLGEISDLVAPYGIISPEAAIAPEVDWDILSSEVYHYEQPEGYDPALEGIFVKDRLTSKTRTTYMLGGSEQVGETFYSGLRGFEKPTSMTGYLPDTGTTAEQSRTSYEYSPLLSSLRRTLARDVLSGTRRTSISMGHEGEEKVVTMREYRRSAQRDPETGEYYEELDRVSRYYYSTDERLLRRVVDQYTPYGSPLFGKKPVTRTVYEYEGEAGHERIAKETDDRGVAHYYRYFVDPDMGLITAVTTNPESFTGAQLPDFDAQVLSSSLMYSVFQDPNYQPTSEGTAVFTDRDGTTVMMVDRYGTVQKYDYKRDTSGLIQRDERGRVLETYIYTPDGTVLMKGPDGYKTKEERLVHDPVSGDYTTVTYTYTYERDPETGDVITDHQGNPEAMKMEWDDVVYERITDTESRPVKYANTRTFAYGVLYSDSRVKHEYLTEEGALEPTLYSNWVKRADGVWELRVGETQEEVEDPESFTMRVDPESGGILDARAHLSGDYDIDGDGRVDVDEDANDNGILDEGEDLDGDGRLDEAEKSEYKYATLTPDEFGNYDFFAKRTRDLASGKDYYVVHVYKGKSYSDKVYTGMTLKYELDENGEFKDLAEFNDRISDMVTLWRDASGENKSLTTGIDYGQSVFFKFDRAPVSQQELIYLEQREQMDFELEGGTVIETVTNADGSTELKFTQRDSLEEAMEAISEEIEKLEAGIELARLRRDKIADSEVYSLVVNKLNGVLTESRTDARREVVYDWTFNTGEEKELQTQPLDPVDEFNWKYGEWDRQYWLWAGLGSGGGVGGALSSMSAYEDMPALSESFMESPLEIVWPRFDWWMKRTELALDNDEVGYSVSATQMDLTEMKRWAGALRDYMTSSFAGDIADYIEYRNYVKTKTSAEEGEAPEEYSIITADEISYMADDVQGDIKTQMDFTDWLVNSGRPAATLLVHWLSALKGGEVFEVDENGNIKFIDEDTNSNGVLDPDEDKNGNGKLDTNEDKNSNGVLDPGEDINGDNILTYGAFVKKEVEDPYYGGDATVIDKLKGINESVGRAFGKIAGAYIGYEAEKKSLVGDFLFPKDQPGNALLFAGDERTLNDIFTSDTLTAGEEEDWVEKARALFKYMVDQKKQQAIHVASTRMQNEAKNASGMTGSMTDDRFPKVDYAASVFAGQQVGLSGFIHTITADDDPEDVIGTVTVESGSIV